MAKLYRCDQCDREFTVDGEPIHRTGTVPFCPYCGRRVWGKRKGCDFSVLYIREA